MKHVNSLKNFKQRQGIVSTHTRKGKINKKKTAQLVVRSKIDPKSGRKKKYCFVVGVNKKYKARA